MFSLKTLSPKQKKLRQLILSVSYTAKYTHLGSCLSAVDILEAIYSLKKPDEPFILSNGHAGVALYCVLADRGFISHKQIETFHIHPDRNKDANIYVSSGSLGQGLPIALGMAFSDRSRGVYCMISDGESTEGSIWEAFRIASDYSINNLKIIVNANGWGAYDPINVANLKKRIRAFGLEVVSVNGHNLRELKKALSKKSKKPLLIFAKTTVEQFLFLHGQDAHYYIMNEEDYNKAMNLLQ